MPQEEEEEAEGTIDSPTLRLCVSDKWAEAQTDAEGANFNFLHMHDKAWVPQEVEDNRKWSELTAGGGTGSGGTPSGGGGGGGTRVAPVGGGRSRCCRVLSGGCGGGGAFINSTTDGYSLTFWWTPATIGCANNPHVQKP